MAEAPIAHDHDRRYKYLFSHSGFVERLVTSFVDEPFVRELDFSTLERVNATFVSEEFARREADVIWKLSFRGAPVFPLLLYTGDPRWSAARSTGELIRPEIPPSFIPQLAYYPILVNEIPAATLRRIHNAVSAVFAVENADPDQVSQTLDELVAILSEEAPEVRSMFATKLKEYGERLKEEAGKEGRRDGRLEGLEEGRQEGRCEAARAMKERGIDVAVIAEVTGLSAEEIEAL